MYRLILTLSMVLLFSGCNAKESTQYSELNNSASEPRRTKKLITQDNDTILNAIRNNNIKKLEQLVKGEINYFSRDDEKIFYSNIGRDFLFRKIKLNTIKFMYHHGLNLNDLKEVRVSHSVEDLLKSNNIQNADIDFKFLKPNIQQLIKSKNLDMEYYNKESYYYIGDEYYIVEIGKHRNSKEVVETILWMLKKGYKPNPMALGFAMAELLARKDVKIDIGIVEKFTKFGMIFVSTKSVSSGKHRSLYQHRIKNRKSAFEALSGLVSSGKMDDIDLLKAFVSRGVSVNSKDWWGRGVASSICNLLSSDEMIRHKKGLINLSNLGLEMRYQALVDCNMEQLEQIQSLNNTKFTQAIAYQKRDLEYEAGLSFIDKLEQMYRSPIGATYIVLFGAGVLSLLFFIFIIYIIGKWLKAKDNKSSKVKNKKSS